MIEKTDFPILRQQLVDAFIKNDKDTYNVVLALLHEGLKPYRDEKDGRRRTD